MTTQEDRSVGGSGMSIPKWMKSKINDKFDFDQSAFSPTEPDDSFMFYYKHLPGGLGSKSGASIIKSTQQITVQQVSNSAKPDFSRHPPPCQKYLSSNNSGKSSSTPQQLSQHKQIKSSGTDDGFKGEAAMCGSSVIRVASQMVSGKVVHGFALKENEACPQTSNGNVVDLSQAAAPTEEKYDGRRRRGSRSLPASPLTSPGSSPKPNRRSINKYFTGAFTDADKPKGGWILSNLLARREMSQSVGYIGEEIKEDLEHAQSALSVDEAPSAKIKTQVFKAKPSELREMNFWSPTSM